METPEENAVTSDPPPEAAWAGAMLDLEVSSGWRSKLAGRKGPNRITVQAHRILIEHGTKLREPLEIAPGGIALVSVDAGPAKVGRTTGRFPILHRLSATSVIPREEGIEGWLWTSTDGSALTLLGEDDEAPNLAIVFLQPLEAEVVEQAFDPSFLEELAKRSPLGSPTVFGVLMRAEKTDATQTAFAKVGLVKPLTDREVPPTQRRHLPTDVPANPSISGSGGSARGSIAPPGMS